jgi:hypothetical protein
MAWTVPRTWGASEVVTAALLNEQIRDNLNETMCAKARTPGGFFTTLVADNVDSDDDSNASIVERYCVSQRISTPAQTTSTTFTDLTVNGVANIGPSVTVETGQQALIFMSCRMQNSVNSALSVMSWGISGATNRVTYFDPISLMQDGAKQTNARWNFSQADHMRGLVPGTNTFTCQYRVGSGTGTFANRFLAVFPL